MRSALHAMFIVRPCDVEVICWYNASVRRTPFRTTIPSTIVFTFTVAAVCRDDRAGRRAYRIAARQEKGFAFSFRQTETFADFRTSQRRLAMLIRPSCGRREATGRRAAASQNSRLGCSCVWDAYHPHEGCRCRRG